MAIYSFQEYLPSYDESKDEPEFTEVYCAVPVSEMPEIFGVNSKVDARLATSVLAAAHIPPVVYMQFFVADVLMNPGVHEAGLGYAVFIMILNVLMITASMVSLRSCFRSDFGSIMFKKYRKSDYKRLKVKLHEDDRVVNIPPFDYKLDMYKLIKAGGSYWEALESVVAEYLSEANECEVEVRKELRSLLLYDDENIDPDLKAAVDRYIIHAKRNSLTIEQAIEDAEYVVRDVAAPILKSLEAKRCQKRQDEYNLAVEREMFQAVSNPQKFLSEQKLPQYSKFEEE